LTTLPSSPSHSDSKHNYDDQALFVILTIAGLWDFYKDLFKERQKGKEKEDNDKPKEVHKRK